MISKAEDRIADALAQGIAVTLGATILAVPWYGLMPVIAACTGLVTACVVFKAVTDGFGK